MPCIFFTTFLETTVEKWTEVVHLMFFGSLKVFAYIIKMHLIILLSVDTTPSCWLIFLCHVSESIVSYVLQENKLHKRTSYNPKGNKHKSSKTRKSFMMRYIKFVHVHKYYKLVERSNLLPEYIRTL